MRAQRKKEPWTCGPPGSVSSALAGGFVAGVAAAVVLILVRFAIGLGAAAAVARLLPWSSLIQVPADVFLGRAGGAGGVLGRLAFQAVWAVALLGAGRAVQALATRKVVVQGG